MEKIEKGEDQPLADRCFLHFAWWKMTERDCEKIDIFPRG